LKRINKKKNKHYSLIIIIIFVFLGIFSTNFFLKTYSLEDDIDDEYNVIEDDRIINEKLNRYIYQEGFYYEDISNEIKNRITGYSFPDNTFDKIDYNDLRFLKVKYYGFDDNIHDDGELIVNKEVALDVLKIFYELYLGEYPIEKIRLVDDYSADDDLSMRDNNTSAFNFRQVENGEKLSWHCFGLAIDINPLYNPYVYHGNVYPEISLKYSDRTWDFNYKIDYKDLAYLTFIKYGWKWGGDFVYSKDYQHFYKDIYDESVRNIEE